MPAEPQRCAHPRGKAGGDPQRAPPERRQSRTGSPRVAAALPAALAARRWDPRGRGNAARFFRLSSRRDVRRGAAHPQPLAQVTGLRERAGAEERQRRGAATGAAPRGAPTRPCQCRPRVLPTCGGGEQRGEQQQHRQQRGPGLRRGRGGRRHGAGERRGAELPPARRPSPRGCPAPSCAPRRLLLPGCRDTAAGRPRGGGLLPSAPRRP